MVSSKTLICALLSGSAALELRMPVTGNGNDDSEAQTKEMIAKGIGLAKVFMDNNGDTLSTLASLATSAGTGGGQEQTTPEVPDDGDPDTPAWVKVRRKARPGKLREPRYFQINNPHLLEQKRTKAAAESSGSGAWGYVGPVLSVAGTAVHGVARLTGITRENVLEYYPEMLEPTSTLPGGFQAKQVISIPTLNMAKYLNPSLGLNYYEKSKFGREVSMIELKEDASTMLEEFHRVLKHEGEAYPHALQLSARPEPQDAAQSGSQKEAKRVEVQFGKLMVLLQNVFIKRVAEAISWNDAEPEGGEQSQLIIDLAKLGIRVQVFYDEGGAATTEMAPTGFKAAVTFSAPVHATPSSPKKMRDVWFTFPVDQFTALMWAHFVHDLDLGWKMAARGKTGAPASDQFWSADYESLELSISPGDCITCKSKAMLYPNQLPDKCRDGSCSWDQIGGKENKACPVCKRMLYQFRNFKPIPKEIWYATLNHGVLQTVDYIPGAENSPGEIIRTVLGNARDVIDTVVTTSTAVYNKASAVASAVSDKAQAAADTTVSVVDKVHDIAPKEVKDVMPTSRVGKIALGVAGSLLVAYGLKLYLTRGGSRGGGRAAIAPANTGGNNGNPSGVSTVDVLNLAFRWGIGAGLKILLPGR